MATNRLASNARRKRVGSIGIRTPGEMFPLHHVHAVRQANCRSVKRFGLLGGRRRGRCRMPMASAENWAPEVPGSRQIWGDSLAADVQLGFSATS